MNFVLPSIKKIAVFRALQLGDLLCAIPAIKALRCAYPEAEIILLGLPWSEILLQRFPNYFDRFIHFPGYEGLPQQKYDEDKFNAFVTAMQQENIDLILQMQGDGTIVNEMLLQLNAKHLAGFSPKKSNDSLFLEYPNQVHEIHRHLQLMEHLGIDSISDHLEFPLFEKNEQEFIDLSLNLEPKKYICIHPGSRGSWRQWPTEYFAKVADYFVSLGFTIVITGTESERHITQQVIDSMNYKAVDCTGNTSLGAMGVLLKNAFMLISNCTGASHIASALNTPSLIISMDGEPNRWKPMNEEISTTIDWTKTKEFDIVFAASKRLYNKLTQNCNTSM